MDHNEMRIAAILADRVMPAAERARAARTEIENTGHRDGPAVRQQLERSFEHALVNLENEASRNAPPAQAKAAHERIYEAGQALSAQARPVAAAPPPAIVAEQDAALEAWERLKETNPLAASQFLLANEGAVVAARQRKGG
jgi:hypothetical protein